MKISDVKPDIDRLNDVVSENYPAERIEGIRKLHLDTFMWQGDHIPMALLCADEKNTIHSYPGVEDPLPFFALKVRNLVECASFASDLIPTASLDYFGDCVLPSMLGCAIEMPERGTAVKDAAYVGPWIMPVIEDMKAVWDLEMPGLDAGYCPAALEAAAFFREHLPDNVNLSTIWKIEPFTLAALLRGTDIYTDCFDYPEELHHLLDFCTDLFIMVEKALRRISGHSDTDNVSHWGIVSPGIRLNGDTIINLSPAILREFVLPRWEKLADAFGGPVYTHYCSTYASKGLHLFDAVWDCPYVAGLSTQVGVEYYRENYDTIKDRFVIESGYTGENTPNYFDTVNSADEWAASFSQVGYKSGMLLSYTARSREHGLGIMRALKRHSIIPE